MDILKIADELVRVKVGGDTYLGVLDEKNGVIKYALDWNNYNIRHWFERYNVGELEDVQLSTNQGFSTRKLIKGEKVILEKCKAVMENIKKYSIQYWENQLFADYYK